jgi:hypothetical protein
MLAPLEPPDDGIVRYFIAPPLEAAARPATLELAAWAFEVVATRGRRRVQFVRVVNEDDALVRLYWVPAASGRTGRCGRSTWAAGVAPPSTSARHDGARLDIAERARLDALFRDTIVHLTCVHELGHALGLRHTAEFEDIMYFFGFGGDIGEFFDRYRRRLKERGDIRAASALSAGDLAQLSALYGRAPVPGQLTVWN